MQFYNLSPQQTIERLKSSLENGLSYGLVEKNLYKYGMNKLTEKKKKSWLVRFLAQFKDAMVIILLISAVVSFIVSKVNGDNDYIDAMIILIIVVINACVGVIQESKAEKAIDALKKMTVIKVRVLRDCEQQLVPAEYLVPGDIIFLDAGDYIPADARIIQCHNLKAKEDALTGENLPVMKFSDAIENKNVAVADQKNMLFSGCFITSGNAICIVTQTGMNTQVGSIAKMINEEVAPLTPLQKSLAKTGKLLGIGAIIICVVIFILGLLQGINPLEMFMIAISLAVAAIPEGLPAVVTIVLALGVKKLAKNRAIIRKLPAVETLGSADVICSDKTGTLTQNKMQVRQISSFEKSLAQSSDEYREILELAILCCNSKMSDSQVIGEPTENAIVIEGGNIGLAKAELDDMYQRIGEKPFDSETKFMTTIHKLPDGQYRVITKGAVEIILKNCTECKSNGSIREMTASERIQIIRQNKAMAEKALRVLAVSYKDVDRLPTENNLIGNSVFLGLIGMIDPPREGVKESVLMCKRAGIKPVMITGDHIDTAVAIAEELGIYCREDKAINGENLDKLSQMELEKEIENYSVFARVTPEHKVKIVKALQKKEKVVAMTGDGVNDAPALKVADIGCAMGKSGTAVAKEAADMILTDDNFSTIVCAIEQGRAVFENIKKTIHFLLSSNIGEIITILSAFLLRIPSPLIAIQLLWVNLVTDSFPALALGVEPTEKDIMEHKIKRKGGAIFTKSAIVEIIIEGSFIGSISMLAFTIGRCFYEDITVGRSMAFCVLSISQLVHSFNMRSEKSVFKIGFFSNKKIILSFVVCLALQVSVISIPFLSAIFKTVPLSFEQWIIVALLSVSPFVIVELEKFIFRKK